MHAVLSQGEPLVPVAHAEGVAIAVIGTCKLLVVAPVPCAAQHPPHKADMLTTSAAAAAAAILLISSSVRMVTGGTPWRLCHVGRSTTSMLLWLAEQLGHIVCREVPAWKRLHLLAIGYCKPALRCLRPRSRLPAHVVVSCYLPIFSDPLLITQARGGGGA